MATDTADTDVESESQHFETVTRTTLSAAAGVAAAFVSSWLTGDMTPTQAALHQPAQAVVLVAIAVQPVLQRLLGVYKDDFGAKDMFFIAFMTFSMWFVTWGIMLSAAS
ncbi:hypothetical protein [Haloarchaeobius sp. TZWWS8]|uniref:EMC6-like membrane protein n=1 Tax=Haloarchaeobius sp. TZWWS8 TaxID=3446121 RepID=UPI003EBF48C7